MGQDLSFVRTSHITLSKQDEVVAAGHGRVSLMKVMLVITCTAWDRDRSKAGL